MTDWDDLLGELGEMDLPEDGMTEEEAERLRAKVAQATQEITAGTSYLEAAGRLLEKLGGDEEGKRLLKALLSR